MTDTKVSYSINYVNIASFVLIVWWRVRFTPKTRFPLTLWNLVSVLVLVQCCRLVAVFYCAPLLIIADNVHYLPIAYLQVKEV
jgi:hypothetical protein